MEHIEIDRSYGRLPVILLVDNSASMGEHGKIDILNNALIGFKTFIEEDELLCKRAEICIVAFGNRVTVLHEFSSIHDFNPPTLQANGPSLMGTGILKALAMLSSRKLFYKKNTIDHYKPQIFFFGGSRPDDFLYTGFDGGKRWDEIRAMLENDIHKRYSFVPFAVIPANLPHEISVCNGEIIIKYGEHDKTIYEKNGEIRSISTSSERGIVNILNDSSGWATMSLDEEDSRQKKSGSGEIVNLLPIASIKTEENHQFSYLRIINTLFPLEVPLRILGSQTDYNKLIIDKYIVDDHPQSKDSIEGPVTLPSVDGWAEITLDDDVKEIKKPNSLNILGASMIGPLHIIEGIPCQDAYAYETLPSGYTIIAIADGLGSASMSEIGSRIAVDAAVEAIKNKTTDEIKNDSLSLLARASVVAARKALEEKALALQCTLRDLASTFISLVIYKDSFVVAHIGDGAVVAKKGEDLFVASEPGDSEYANEVTPLTSKKWEEPLNITPVYDGISGIMAFSDGLQRAALRKSEDKRIPYKAFCDPLFSFAREINSVSDGERDLKEFLSSEKLSDHSEDDKTLILVTFENSY